MVQINFGQREVSCKVVFYGPGMSGKTTNLEVIHKKAPKDAVGEMVSIATETDRTLYFDFLPLDLGQVAGMRTKFQLYTVPGQIYYNATRKLVLQGVDGVIFVADSSPEKMAENLESLQNLRDNLAEMGLKVEDVPLVLQYNKRDLPTAMSIPDMNAQMNPMGAPVFEGVARDGKGVFATLKEISRLVIEKLNKEHAPASTRRRTAQNLETARSPSSGQPVQNPSGASRIPPMPPAPPRPPAPPTLPQGTSTTPLGNRLQQRHAPPPPPPRPPSERSVPAVQPRSTGVPKPAYSPTPAAGNPLVPPPPAEDHGVGAKEKHLAKAKPPAIEKRAPGQDPDLGATDPNLRRYQERRSGGGGKLLIVFMLLIIVLLLVASLFAFLPPLRAMLPLDLQKWLRGDQAPTSAPVAPPAAEPAKAPAPTAAPAPQATAPQLAPPAEPAARIAPAPAAPVAPAAAEAPASEPAAAAEPVPPPLPVAPDAPAAPAADPVAPAVVP